MSLSDAWERHARQWIDWARTSKLDGFWNGTWPELCHVLPEPSGVALDLGCGEGRLMRKLKPLGYAAVGLDRSPTLLRATAAVDPSLPVVLADAAATPFRDECVDLVVASMVLLDVDDLDGTLREISRLLRPNGILCFAIVHPFASAQDEAWVKSTPQVNAPYLADRRYELQVAGDGAQMTFVSMHRPLSRYIDALTTQGLVVTALREFGDALIPWLMVVRAEKR